MKRRPQRCAIVPYTTSLRSATEPEVEEGGELERALDPDDLENDPREREDGKETEEKEAPRAVSEVEDGGSVGTGRWRGDGRGEGWVECRRRGGEGA